MIRYFPRGLAACSVTCRNLCFWLLFKWTASVLRMKVPCSGRFARSYPWRVRVGGASVPVYNLPIRTQSMNTECSFVPIHTTRPINLVIYVIDFAPSLHTCDIILIILSVGAQQICPRKNIRSSEEIQMIQRTQYVTTKCCLHIIFESSPISFLA